MSYAVRFQGRVNRVEGDDEIHAARRAVMMQVNLDDPANRGRSYQVEVCVRPDVLRSIEQDSSALDLNATRVIVDVGAEQKRGYITGRRA